MTLGQVPAARMRLIARWKSSARLTEPDVDDLVVRHGATTTMID
jgi:hypothetical protein